MGEVTYKYSNRWVLLKSQEGPHAAVDDDDEYNISKVKISGDGTAVVVVAAATSSSSHPQRNNGKLRITAYHEVPK